MNATRFSPTRLFALIFGILFMLAAVGGFVPLVTPPVDAHALPLHIDHPYGLLIGLFPVNAVHNLVHLAYGLGGLFAYRSVGASRWYARIMAITLGVLTVLGLIPAMRTVGGVLPLYGHAIWLHGLEAVLAAYVGWGLREDTKSAAVAAAPVQSGR
jgi:hypothetical protein